MATRLFVRNVSDLRNHISNSIGCLWPFHFFRRINRCPFIFFKFRSSFIYFPVLIHCFHIVLNASDRFQPRLHLRAEGAMLTLWQEKSNIRAKGECSLQQMHHPTCFYIYIGMWVYRRKKLLELSLSDHETGFESLQGQFDRKVTSSFYRAR